MKPLMKVERKVLERKRRLQMKALCLQLNSLIPNDNKNSSSSSSSKSSLSQLHHLDQAARYIKELKERVETLKEMKEMKINNENNNNNNITNINDINENEDEEMPVIEVRKVDSNLEVVLVSKMDKQVKFHEVVRVLGEEGAEIDNASFSIVGDKIFHTVHSEVNCSGMDFNCPAMLEKLQELFYRRDISCSSRMQE